MTTEVPAVVWMSVVRVALCADAECNTLYALRERACPVCGSETRFALSRVLNRDGGRATRRAIERGYDDCGAPGGSR
jgi:hypothetical protein